MPRFLVGIYSWRNEARDVTYLRFAFGGDIAGHEPDRRLDDGIVAARWLTPQEIRASADRHRSPLVLRCVEDFMAGKPLPAGTADALRMSRWLSLLALLLCSARFWRRPASRSATTMVA